MPLRTFSPRRPLTSYAKVQATVGRLLAPAGFAQVARRRFGEGTDPQRLIDTPARCYESLYVEAAPGSAVP